MEEMEICSNCKREIRSVNYVTHSVHCHRNIVICPKCKEPVPRTELDEHDAHEHGLVACKDCGVEVQKPLLQIHERESCTHRKVACPYCELELKGTEAADHANYCGTRTQKCDECGEYVMMKYQALHIDSNHGFVKLEDEPGPPASWETSMHTAGPSTIPIKSVEPSRPILKSSTRGPSSSQMAIYPRRPHPNSVRFARLEDGNNSKIQKMETQTMFANNKIGAEVKPIISPNTARDSSSPTAGTSMENNAPVVDEEADRLLAFKIAQDEMEMVSKLQLQGILHQRRKMTEKQKSEDTPMEVVHESDDRPAQPTSLLSQRSLGGVKPASSQREGVPSTSQEPETITIWDSEPSNEEQNHDAFEDVKIPCEFCEVLVPASRLLLHQTGCRPDIVCYTPFRPGTSSRADVDEDIEITDSDINPSTSRTHIHNTIPCDLCNASIPEDKFIQHQLACEIKNLPGRQDKPKALVMPLSGKTLKASKSIDETILPALESLEKEADMKNKHSSMRNSSSTSSLGESSGTSSEMITEDPEDSEKKARQGAVPKQKARSKKSRPNSYQQP